MPAHSWPGFPEAPPPRGPNSPWVASSQRSRPSATPPLAGPAPPLRPPRAWSSGASLRAALRTRRMFLRAVGSGLTLLFRTPGLAAVAASTPGLAAVAAMSTGTFVQLEPLNYRGGARVEPVDSSGTEKAFEPATGNRAGRGWSGLSLALCTGSAAPCLPSEHSAKGCWTCTAAVWSTECCGGSWESGSWGK